ncbi:hypothetical protein Tco_0955422, partial [Tanacetum coccineum]
SKQPELKRSMECLVFTISLTPKSNASEEKDEDVELIVVPSAVTILEEIVDSKTSSKNLKEKRRDLTRSL